MLRIYCHKVVRAISPDDFTKEIRQINGQQMYHGLLAAMALHYFHIGGVPLYTSGGRAMAEEEHCVWPGMCYAQRHLVGYYGGKHVGLDRPSVLMTDLQTI